MSPSHQKVTTDAEVFIALFHATMRRKGYRMKSFTQSAATEFRYSKGADPIRDYEIAIDMHHGRGKWGPGKAILGMYHNHKQLFNMPITCVKGDPDSPIDYATSEYTARGAEIHAEMVANIHKFLEQL